MKNSREFPESVRAPVVEAEFAMADKRLAENLGPTQIAIRTDRRGLLIAAIVCMAAGCSSDMPANLPGLSAIAPSADRTELSSRYSEPLEIRIEGREFQWYLRYAGPDGQFGTADDALAMHQPHIP